jgi:hypothetical protein
MARPNIEEVRSLGDFSTVYNWNVYLMPSVGSLVSPRSVGEGTTNWFNMRCISASLPTLSDAKVQVGIRGHKVFQPGVHTYSSNITFTVVEAVDTKIMRFLADWRELCWKTRLGSQATKAQSSITIEIDRLNRQDQTIWSYSMFGCFLENYTLPEMAAEGMAFTPTLNIAYDYYSDITQFALG